MASFRPLAPTRARWRPCEGVGLEHLDLQHQGDRIVAEGIVIGTREGIDYGASYRVTCDPDWRTLSLDVALTDGRGLHIRSDGDGRWHDEAHRPLPAPVTKLPLPSACAQL